MASVRVCNVTYVCGTECQYSIPAELEGRSEVLQNALAASSDGCSLALPVPAHGLDAWMQFALAENVVKSDAYPIKYLLKALMVRARRYQLRSKSCVCGTHNLTSLYVAGCRLLCRPGDCAVRGRSPGCSCFRCAGRNWPRHGAQGITGYKSQFRERTKSL